MPFTYGGVVPWGRSFDEYQRMFALTEQDLNLRIIGCADGPAAFNAHMFKLGRRMVSCDPLYQLTAMEIQGKRTGRYVAAELPDLPFEAASFDLALCSHFLFLYSDNLSLAFHLEAIEAMCRVAKEARIFPLLTYNAERSLFVEPVVEKLIRGGYQVSTEDVAYEFQRGGNKMLRVSR